jgi:hypothetical protein
MSQGDDARAVFERLMHRMQPDKPRAAGPMFEELPTIDEALQMFRERPDLAAVMTEQGTLTRDGRLIFPSW